MNYNPIERRMNGHNSLDEHNDFFPHGERNHRRDRFADGPAPMPRGGFRHGSEAFHTMPRRHGGPGRFDDAPEMGREDLRCTPRGHGGPGFPPHGGIHGGPDGGMPPRRPDPDFLKRRIEESDLMELIDMAGRMAQRRPQGGPARGQALILSILAGREALSQRELQQMLGIQPGSLSELISKLEAKGLLTREKAQDRRGNLLRITDAGRQAIPQVDTEEQDDPFAPLTDDQQNQLAALLRSLLTAWVDDMEPAAPHGRRLAPFHHDKPVEI